MDWSEFFVFWNWPTVRKKGFLLLAVTLLLNQSWSGVVVGQSLPSGIDLDPPVIDHEALERGVAGEPQRFSALVVDDRGIESVQLFYRPAASGEYANVTMSQIADTDNYTATVNTDASQRRIEYYIEVLDIGGNRVLKGFPFYPLVRGLNIPKINQTQLTRAPVPQEAVSSGPGTLLYVVVGVLAVGLLASLASGGGDSGGGEPPPNDQVPLTINVSPP